MLLEFTLIIALGINSAISFAIRKIYPQYFLLLLYVVTFAAQVGWLLIYLLVTNDSTIDLYGLSSFAPDMRAAPYAIAFGLIGVPFSCISVAFFLSLSFARSRVDRFRLLRFKELRSSLTGRGFQLSLMVLATCGAGWIVGEVLFSVPIVTPILTYLYGSTTLIPLFIGYYWRECKKPLYVYFCVLFFVTFFALGFGGRGLILYPIAFFSLGFLFSFKGRKLYIVLFSMTLLSPLVFMSSGIIELLRYRIDRSDSVTTIEKIFQIVDIANKVDLNAGPTVEIGLRRMVPWTNIAAPILVPEVVPYRGYSDWIEEIIFINQSNLFIDKAEVSLQERTIDSNFSYGAAKELGFTIGMGITVPFPIIAEGWHRAGLFGVILNGVIMTVFLIGAEVTIRKIFRRSQVIVLLLLMILSSIPVQKAYENGVLYCVRNLVMATIFWGFIFWIMQKIFGKKAFSIGK